MHLFRVLFVYLLAGLISAGTVVAKVMPVEFDAGRNRLIAYMLSHQLPAQHYGHEFFNDKLSRAAFDLYLRQLDPRKRFLLKSDAGQLQAFADLIDDELRRGRIILPDAGLQVLNERIKEVQSLVETLMDAGFDPNREDYLELDPKKIDFVETKIELRNRWRRSLKLQVLDRYLDIMEEKEGGSDVEIKLLPFDKEKWVKAMDKVRKSNRHQLHRLLQVTRQEHYNRYYDAVARAFDPHTNYMAPTSKEDFDIHMSGSLEGIGALLREDEGQVKVVRIIPGSAAERQGQLHAEDTILSVAEKEDDPVDISDMRIREAVGYIRGPKGTEVRLTVQRPDGAKLVIPIIRDVVQMEETYVKSTVLEDERGLKIGYIRIPGFYRDFNGIRNGSKGRNVTDDTRGELYKLKKEGVAGLILDLRNNGGGALTDAVDISGLFLPGGPVVQVKNSQGMIRVLEDEDKNVAYDGAMIVLVNKFSASASEILAAALQDYKRALVVGGEHTHGKGTVQALMDMNRNLPLLHLKKYDDLGALKVTIQKFYRINGDSTQYKGVEPDIVVPSMLEYLKSGEKFMDYSLPWDQVENIGYERWRGERFDVKDTRGRALKWVEANSTFQKIREESKKAMERSEQTKVAVFLKGMLKERQEISEARAQAKIAGLLHPDDMENITEKKEQKDLKEQLADDPFIDMAMYLMDGIVVAEQSVGNVQ